MEIIKSAKIKIGGLYLRHKVKGFQRRREMKNYSSSSTIGILFEATNKEDFKPVKDFLSYLTKLGLKVFIIGYIDKNKVDDFYLARKGFNFISKKDLNWLCMPSVPFVDDFIEMELDILLDLTNGDIFPIKTITTRSKALCKVGKYTKTNDFYDLMLDVKENCTLDYYIEQLRYYLTIINKKEEVEI
jgi:hypothetical protein